MCKKQRGYTLIEVIVVLALLGIVAGVAVSSYHLLRKYQVEAVVGEIEDVLYLAQHTAHFENTSTFVEVKKKHNTYFFQCDNQNILEKEVAIPVGMVVTIHTEDGRLSFKKDLTPVKGGTISVVDQRTGRQIRITLLPVTGKVTRYYDS